MRFHQEHSRFQSLSCRPGMLQRRSETPKRAVLCLFSKGFCDNPAQGRNTIFRLHTRITGLRIRYNRDEGGLVFARTSDVIVQCPPNSAAYPSVPNGKISDQSHLFTSLTSLGLGQSCWLVSGRAGRPFERARAKLHSCHPIHHPSIHPSI